MKFHIPDGLAVLLLLVFAGALSAAVVVPMVFASQWLTLQLYGPVGFPGWVLVGALTVVVWAVLTGLAWGVWETVFGEDLFDWLQTADHTGVPFLPTVARALYLAWPLLFAARGVFSAVARWGSRS